jgi:hypothetical protein
MTAESRGLKQPTFNDSSDVNMKLIPLFRKKKEKIEKPTGNQSYNVKIKRKLNQEGGMAG